MTKAEYSKPSLTTHGAVVSLTLGKSGSDIDSRGGMGGLMSMMDMDRMGMWRMARR